MSEHSQAIEQDAVRDALPAYRVNAPEIAQDDVPQGYKRTEVGVIPEDWDVCALREGVTLQSGHHVLAQWCNTAGEGVPYLTGPADFPSGVIQQTKFTTKSTTICENGDLLLTVKGSGAGALIEADGRYCISRQLMAIRVTKWNPRFIYFSLLENSSALADAVTGLIPGLSRGDVLSQALPIPSSATEQRTIATALSDADALIESLDRLIAKKRAIKQAAMQQLLTGQTRLPGFSGPWEKVAPDDIAARITGFWGSSERTVETPHKVRVIRAGDISPLGVLTDSAVRYFSDVEIAKAACQPNDVVITVSGNGLGKTWLVDDQSHMAASNFVRILRQKHGRLHGPFLAAALQGRVAHQLLAEHTATSAYPNLRPTFFSACWLPLPPIGEQTAIATILSDMDTEIEALEHRRDKARQIKQGMMQQLLTGRVRLVNHTAGKSEAAVGAT